MTTSSSPRSSSDPSLTEPVTVIGLGPMGEAIARTLLAADVRVTVWNRSAGPADRLAALGAAVAADVGSAVSASGLVLVVLRDHATTREVLGAVVLERLRGRTIVSLASSTPDEARASARWAAEQGLTWLTGAIMVPTPVIGTPDAQVLYGGPGDVLERHRATLAVVAPRSEHVGSDAGLASALDTAMLGVFFASMTAFVHAAAMVTAQGLSATDFAGRARDVLGILEPTFEGIAADVDAGRYPGHEDRVSMDVAALEHITQTSEELGIDASLPRLLRDLGRRAVEGGHGDAGWSSVVEVVRRAP